MCCLKCIDGVFLFKIFKKLLKNLFSLLNCNYYLNKLED